MTKQNHTPVVLVVGGGISGLTVAYKLLKQATQEKVKLDVKIIEKTNCLGGTIKTYHYDDFVLEEGPDCFLSEKREAVDLSKELQIDSELISTKEQHRQSFILCNNKLHIIPKGLHLLAPVRISSFLKSSLISWPGKMRMAMDVIIPKKQNLCDESLASFVRRRLGNEALEKIAQPMIAGIYAADPEKLSLQATMPRFLEMEQKHRSIIWAMQKQKFSGQTKDSFMNRNIAGPRYGLFLSYKNGMQTLINSLKTNIPSRCIHLNTKAAQIDSSEHCQWKILTSDHMHYSADALCLASPAFQNASMLQENFPDLSEVMKTVDYASSATVNFIFHQSQIKHPLNGMGFVVCSTYPKTLLACTFTTQKFSNRAPQDHVILRAFVGGKLQEQLLLNSDSLIIESVLQDLKSLLGITGQPIFSHMVRWDKCMPQYSVGHINTIHNIHEKIKNYPGLYITGSAYHGVGIPDIVRQSTQIAQQIFEYVCSERHPCEFLGNRAD